MKDSEFLKLTRAAYVREMQRQCGVVFICLKMNMVQNSELDPENQSARMQRWIISMIGCFTFCSWLGSNGVPPFQQSRRLKVPEYPEPILAANLHRLAWLDQLIAICEAEGA
jgi:hypothetical protein